MLARKTLRLSGSARLARGTGAILNLQSNDCDVVMDLPYHTPQLLFVPLQVGTMSAHLLRGFMARAC